MPRGTWVAAIVHELMPPAFLIRTVQMAEPTRMVMLAMTVIEVENPGIQGCLRVYSVIPLGGIMESESRPKISEWDRTDLIRAMSAMVAPLNKKRRAMWELPPRNIELAKVVLWMMALV